MRIVPPAEIWYRGLVFSADGNFLYYVTNENVRSAGALYRVPVLGGTPERVSEGVDSVITVSPDGARIAFVRMNRLERESALMVANTDGSGERALTVRQRPDYFSLDGPSWSPDGSIVAVGEGGVDSSGYYMKVVGINPDDGKESAITSQRWSWLGQISWLGDGRGIVVIGWHQASPIYADQIWHVSYPGGEARRVTNDLNGYSGISVDRDSDSIVTTQTVRVSRICIVPDRDETRSVQVGSGFGDNYSEYLGITWTPDGRIVYGSHASGNPDIWVMDADGANQRQLTFDPHTDLAPAVSPDGRYIVFVSNRAGANNIWRMDADGSDPKQLTYGRGEDLPSITPDGRWVVYADAGRDTPSIWKVAIDGGEPIQITHWVSGRPAVSPDGEWIACHYLDMKSAQVRLAVVPIDGGEPRRMFDTYLPNLQAVRWAPDSKSIRYIDTKTGVSNIWSQPIDGSPPRQLTDFKSDSIYRFAWSPDGRRLACERGVTLSDVILISNLEN
jgi:TolB protein